MNHFARRKVVKPVHAYEREEDNPGWLVMDLNTFEDFADDWHRFGPRVALHNLWVMLFGGVPCL